LSPLLPFTGLAQSDWGKILSSLFQIIPYHYTVILLNFLVLHFYESLFSLTGKENADKTEGYFFCS
jgi:hypothetical protein